MNETNVPRTINEGVSDKAERVARDVLEAANAEGIHSGKPRKARISGPSMRRPA